MKLIIEMPEELYKDIKENGLCGYCSDREIVSEAIANGTPWILDEAIDGEGKEGNVKEAEAKKCPNCGSDLYEHCYMCCYEGEKVMRNESDHL